MKIYIKLKTIKCITCYQQKSKKCFQRILITKQGWNFTKIYEKLGIYDSNFVIIVLLDSLQVINLRKRQQSKLMTIFGTLFIIVLLISSTSSQNSSLTCHYSCKSCAGSSYTLCLDCLSDQNLTIVEDPTKSEVQFINSKSVSGVCIGRVPQGANAVGIIMLIFCIATAIIVRTKQSIYLISTLQNLALLSFIEIAWIDPSGYLLQSLQYFLFGNVIISSTKTGIVDFTMKQRQFYRLHQYFRTSNFIHNLSFIGLLGLLIFIGMLGIAIWKWRRQRKNKQMQFEQIQQKNSKYSQQISNLEKYSDSSIKNQPDKRTTSQKIIDVIFKVLQVIFYFTIIETSLVIMVGLRFPIEIAIQTIIISIVYCFMLLLFMIYTWFYPVWYFPNIQTQFINIWRKIALPVLTIVPPQYHFLIIAFMIIFMLAQSFFESKGGEFKLLSRITLYKILQLIVLILALAFYLTQTGSNLLASSQIIRVFFAIFLLAFFVCMAAELIFGLIQIFCASKVQNQHASNLMSQQKQGQRYQTENQIKERQDDEFPVNNTLGVINDNSNRDKQKLEIFDVEDIQDFDQNENENNANQKLQPVSRSRTQPLNNLGFGLNDSENKGQDLIKDQKIGFESNDSENKVEGQDINKDQKINQNNDSDQKKDQNLYMMKHEEADKKQIKESVAETKDNKNTEQNVNTLVAEELEPVVRPRKKKAYKGQMDPQLRKRYGL